jgi:phosphoglycolate phosphatase
VSAASRFQLIAFDLDGTLVDSRHDLAGSANAMLQEAGCAPLTEDAILRMVGEGAPVLVARVFAAAGRPQPPDALERFLSIYDGRLLQFTRPYPGIPDLLAALQPRVTLAVLTNKPLVATQAILDGLSLAPFFHDRVVGGDGPFLRKPDPGGLRHLMAAAGATPETTLLVGDSMVDWRAAKAAATSSCLVRYGFGFQGVSLEELSPSDLLIDHPSDLLSAVGF